MYKKDQIDMYPTDSAVEFSGVTKTFTQWQRDNNKRNILRNLLKPEKRIITALDDVSFSVKRGEFVAYAGPNGAGKSTTMKLLGGMLLPNSGEISVLGMSPEQNRVRLMNRLGILFGNRTELWWDHPIIQSYEWKKVVWDIPDDVYQKNLYQVTELLDLGDLLKTFARELSLGQRMRADLGMLLLHSPEIVLLDEPTLGLDVVAKQQMIKFLKLINKEQNITIVVTSHDMDDLEQMAERVLMISGGQMAYDGSFDGLRDITGSLTRIRIAAGATAPLLQNAKLLETNQNVYEYEIDLKKTPISTLLQSLSVIDSITDVQIEKAPIEDVIAQLYLEWKAS